jgi:hypothetical protein
MDYKFGRLKSFDERSRNFPVRTLVRGLEPISKLWDCPVVLDQGNEGSCVGHGIAHELIATPVPMAWVDHTYARKIYKMAQTLDEWPGTDYEGTSVNAGLKAIKNWGLCTSWNWSFSHLDTQLGISHVSPGIAGTNWMTGMMDLDSEGFIHATGVSEGGHCYLYLGIDTEKQAFIIQNSWYKKDKITPWGRGGRAFISFEDYEKLRSNGGEMAFLVGETDTGGAEKGCWLCNWIRK